MDPNDPRYGMDPNDPRYGGNPNDPRYGDPNYGYNTGPGYGDGHGVNGDPYGNGGGPPGYGSDMIQGNQPRTINVNVTAMQNGQVVKQICFFVAPYCFVS